LQQKTSYNVIGTTETWLSFWSTYSASLLGSFITLYVLFRTLKQNEANNEESKQLQLTIYQKGLEERRIQELAKTFKESLHFIDFTQVRHNQTLIQNQYYSEAKEFFYKESTRAMNNLSSYALDFISINMDKKILEFKNDYKEIIEEYCKLINLIIRILIFLRIQSFEKKKIDFQKLQSVDNTRVKSLGKENLIFSDKEFNKIIESKNEQQFNNELITVLNNRIDEFTSIYSSTQKILIRKSTCIITEKVKKLETLS